MRESLGLARVLHANCVAEPECPDKFDCRLDPPSFVRRLLAAVCTTPRHRVMCECIHFFFDRKEYVLKRIYLFQETR